MKSFKNLKIWENVTNSLYFTVTGKLSSLFACAYYLENNKFCVLSFGYV